MKRGEIYFIYKRDTIGNEIAKARPGIIVSNDAINRTSGVVEVVYLTTQPKKELPTHVTINSSGVPSVACCEQIDSVSVQLVGDYRGTCTTKEMQALNKAMQESLGIVAESPTEDGHEEPMEHDPVNHPSHYTSDKIEVIDFIEDKKLGFHLGNAVKYIARAGKKDPTKTTEDLKKARWYIDRVLQQSGESEAS